MSPNQSTKGSGNLPIQIALNIHAINNPCINRNFSAFYLCTLRWFFYRPDASIMMSQQWHWHNYTNNKYYHYNYYTHTTHTQPFYGLFPGPPGWVSARRELLNFMVQGKINRCRHTDHPARRHSIRTNQCPPPPSPMFFTGCMPFLPPSQQCQCIEGN